MPRHAARLGRAGAPSHLQRAAPRQWASLLACGQWPLFLSPVWILLFIEVARALALQSNLSHAPPERVRADRALVEFTQTISEQVHCPDCRWISEQKRIPL